MVVFIPKPKPDQVIRHEIVFGRSERDLIEGALVAYQVNRIATPAVALISDVSAMAIVFSALGTYLGFKFEIFQGGYATGVELVRDFLNQYSAFKDSLPDREEVENAAQQAAVGAAGFIPGGGPGLQYLLRQLFG